MDPQKGENKQYTTPELVFDKDGYVQSFDIDTATDEELKQFYQRYGILVFRNAINEQQIARTVDDLWNSTTSYYKNMLNKHIDRNDQKTWNNMRGFQKAFGFVGDTILEEPQIWENRKNHKIYKMFKRSYEASSGHELKQPLICNFDRGSLMLPSKINSDWQTSDIYHFDIDPWSWTGLAKNRHYKYDYDPDKISMLLGEGNYDPNVGYTKLAGVLALSDTNEDSGGFECACGFQNYIKQWCQQNQNHKRIQQDKNLVNNFRKIFVRKGSLMIFSRQLPHNIYQNRSENFRYAQYLRMSPLSALCLNEQLIEARKKLIKIILPKQLDVSDSISKQIFMLEEDYVHANGEKMGKQQQIMGQKQKQVKKQDQNISSNGWKKCSIN